MLRAFLVIFVSCICSTTTWPSVADSNTAQFTVEHILDEGRPPNLFKLTYQNSEGACDSVAREINTGRAPGSNRGDYFAILTATNSNVTWSLVPRIADLKALYVEETRADIFNDGQLHIVFRVHGSVGDREFDSLYADRIADQSSSTSALNRVAPQGKFNSAFAVPPGALQDYYATVHAGLPENRGLPRYDIIKVHEVTYVVEGSFYAFAPFDAILVYVGRPDHEFSVECSFDPQTVIPPQP
jgi:hypothetical protein